MIERIFSAEGAMMLGWAVVVLLCASDPFGHENSWGWRLLRSRRALKRIQQGNGTLNPLSSGDTDQ